MTICNQNYFGALGTAAGYLAQDENVHIYIRPYEDDFLVICPDLSLYPQCYVSATATGAAFQIALAMLLNTSRDVPLLTKLMSLCLLHNYEYEPFRQRIADVIEQLVSVFDNGLMGFPQVPAYNVNNPPTWLVQDDLFSIAEPSLRTQIARELWAH